MAEYGRPLKGKTRRVPITVHTPLGYLDIIDEYVEQKKSHGETAYSRSDFFTEALEEHMKSVGIYSYDEK